MLLAYPNTNFASISENLSYIIMNHAVLGYKPITIYKEKLSLCLITHHFTKACGGA
jgi:hypothetical protein